MVDIFVLLTNTEFPTCHPYVRPFEDSNIGEFENVEIKQFHPSVLLSSPLKHRETKKFSLGQANNLTQIPLHRQSL